MTSVNKFTHYQPHKPKVSKSFRNRQTISVRTALAEQWTQVEVIHAHLTLDTTHTMLHRHMVSAGNPHDADNCQKNLLQLPTDSRCPQQVHFTR